MYGWEEWAKMTETPGCSSHVTTILFSVLTLLADFNAKIVQRSTRRFGCSSMNEQKFHRQSLHQSFHQRNKRKVGKERRLPRPWEARSFVFFHCNQQQNLAVNNRNGAHSILYLKGLCKRPCQIERSEDSITQVTKNEVVSRVRVCLRTGYMNSIIRRPCGCHKQFSLLVRKIENSADSREV